jgi:hypothetical protein
MKKTKNNFAVWTLLLLAVMIAAGCKKSPTTPQENPTVNATGTVTMTATPQAVNSRTFTATITATNTKINTGTVTATVTATATATTLTAQAGVNLRTAARFAVLSATSIDDIPSSSIFGDVGISSGARSTITGLLDGDGQVNPAYAIYAFDDLTPAGVPAMLTQAYDDSTAAYLDATDSARGTPAPVSGNLNGLTLYPGLYESTSSIEISAAGFLYLDGQGDSNAVFIIRSATTITTSSTSEVVLTNGTQAKNVYWTAGSAVTLGTASIMKGTIIASTSITLQTGCSLTGRALVQSAAGAKVAFDTSTIVLP